MLNLLIASLLALVYTNDIFTAYVFIEINTVAACSIVLAKESGETIRATIKYFIMSALGSGLFLMGLAILYSLTGHLLMGNLYTSIQELALTGEYNIPLTVSFVLIIVSLGIKSALFPFYGWLPDAHSSATATSSAILSGLVLKGYIVLLLKIIYRVYGINIAKQLNILNILFILGFLSMIIGSIFALTQKDLKKDNSLFISSPNRIHIYIHRIGKFPRPYSCNLSHNSSCPYEIYVIFSQWKIY